MEGGLSLVLSFLTFVQRGVLIGGEKLGPDAGIVNFYQLKDTLMGHVDRSEWVLDGDHSCRKTR